MRTVLMISPPPPLTDNPSPPLLLSSPSTTDRGTAYSPSSLRPFIFSLVYVRLPDRPIPLLHPLPTASRPFPPIVLPYSLFSPNFRESQCHITNNLLSIIKSKHSKL